MSGVVLIRQRPGSAKGVCFITLEDETGVVNLVVWPDTMEKYRRVIMGARLMEVKGRVEMDDEVIHVIVTELTDATQRLAELSHDLLAPSVARADEVNRPARTMSAVKHKVPVDVAGAAVPQARNADCAPRQTKHTLRLPAPRADPRGPALPPAVSGHPRNLRILPKSRDFH